MSKNTDQGKGKGKDKSNEIDKVIYLLSLTYMKITPLLGLIGYN